MEIALVVLIVLFGALMRTVFGFGEALVTMPLLALISFDLKTSIALIGALGLLVALPATIRYREHINFAVVRRLVTGSIFGVPVGILLITYVKTSWIMRGLSIFLVLYGTYSLIKVLRQHQSKPHLQADAWDYLAGLISGILGSAYNSHGVPIVVYGALKKWPVKELRGILQAHFLCVGVIVVFSHVVSGFWSLEVVKILLICLPLLVFTIWLGNWLTYKINNQQMVKYIYGLLIVFGLILFVRA
ncbi:sulfite exporter TauE/SafE family protein [Agrilactobacillus fermenti]|uniref:sulfite exporter TauE/SafE family protein n=1 Tax=Agrilactobacillus fermenti TaxID=2586909 RepID=UPI001E5195A4|nr:sulfite exporter TauE/SafE family protein [Agrilactobacillus fermenti]MCD2255382.1 sulfite exporter TauE/SafE family protein [Agrilactobacillus fermenti]